MNRVTRSFLPDNHLQLSSVGYRLAIDFSNDVPGPQTGFCSRGVRLNVADQRTLSFIHVEELGVVGSYIGNLNSDERMRYLAIPNQRLHRRLYDLSRNREAHS